MAAATVPKFGLVVEESDEERRCNEERTKLIRFDYFR